MTWATAMRTRSSAMGYYLAEHQGRIHHVMHLSRSPRTCPGKGLGSGAVQRHGAAEMQVRRCTSGGSADAGPEDAILPD